MATRGSLALVLALVLGLRAQAAELSGWAEPVPATVDLTAAGSSDWVHWGTGSGASPWSDRKVGGASQISPFTSINGGPYGINSNSSLTCSWSDGTPNASAAGTASEIRMINAGDGVTLTVPADASVRTLRIYVSVYNAGGAFTAHLSDGSAADYSDGSFFCTGDSKAACYAVVYSAASAGQTLTISWKMASQLGSWGSANLHAAALAVGTGTPAASAPAAPGRLSVIPGDTMATLHWQRLSGARSYNLYRSVTANPPASPTRSGITAFTAPSTPNSEGFLVEYADLGLANGTAYSYWVSQVDTAGHESALSAVASATPAARPTSAITTDRVLKVVPLGDSITEGAPGAPAVPDGGYRQTLLNGLRGAGYQAIFVGSYTDFSGAMADPLHEGWPGRTIRQIRDDVMPRTLSNEDPDLLLLMIGTNDLAWGHKSPADVTTAIADYNQLLTGIFARKPGVTLVVSPILPIDNGSDSAGAANQAANVTSFNTQLATLVQSFAASGRHISFAHAMASFPGAADQVDGVHPNTAGYAFLANAWLSAIQAITGTSTGTPTGFAPSLTVQPADQSVAAGQSATFSATASGSPTPTFQWLSAPVGGTFTAIAGATSASYTTPPTSLGQNGTRFEVVATNSVGNATSSAATLTVSALALDPLIVAAARFDDGAGAWNGGASTADKAFDGESATFYDCASADGGFTGIDTGTGTTATVTAIRYWARSGFPGRMVGGVFEGSNAQASGYTTLATVTTASDAAWTTVAVTSAAPYRYLRYRGPGGGNCNVAEIEFHGTMATAGGGGGNTGAPPAITSQPVSQTVSAGQTATFTVVASGAGPLAYQWLFGTTVVGAGATLTIANAQAANAGTYRVTVTNGMGSVASTPVTLTVTAGAGAPSITSPLAASGVVGQAFIYHITADGGPTGYWAVALPGGLTCDAATGVIAGTPTAAGTTTVPIGADYGSGQAQAALVITVTAASAGPGGGTASPPAQGQVSGTRSGCGLGAGVAAWVLAMIGLGYRARSRE